MSTPTFATAAAASSRAVANRACCSARAPWSCAIRARLPAVSTPTSRTATRLRSRSVERFRRTASRRTCSRSLVRSASRAVKLASRNSRSRPAMTTLVALTQLSNCSSRDPRNR